MKPVTTTIALIYVITALYIGYIALGLLPSLLFSFGFLGGFILWRWIPTEISWKKLRIPYFITLILFVIHKIEENKMDFFPTLSKITGVPVPEVTSLPAILLLVIASAWLLIPFLVGRSMAFGYFLSWTFFVSMGFVELAHFMFPLFIHKPYGYFPGMWSVIPMAPVAWWGLYRLCYKSENLNIH